MPRQAKDGVVAGGAAESSTFAAALGLAVGLLAPACLEAEPFECETDAQCNLDGEMGRCQDVGYCSYDDDECDSRQRFHEDAPPEYAGQCVE